METIFLELPAPLEILTDPIILIIYAIYGILFLWETFFPARQLPKIRYWKLRGFVFFVVFLLMTTYLPLLWDGFFSSYQLIDLSGLPLFAQMILGIVLVEFVQYVWHFSMHKSDLLFRVSHQIHHSSERIDTPSAFIFSLNDMIGLALVGSVSFALIMGLAPQAITYIILTTMFLGIFQHANIKTPRWLGYIIQRPESHSLHHGMGIHQYNYSDLPLIDILFGTFRNPESFQDQTGYYLGASNRLIDMLRFKDVTQIKGVSNDTKK